MRLTLSQTALARRLAVTTLWIRKHGQYVIWRGEKWERDEYLSNGRLAGYVLIESLADVGDRESNPTSTDALKPPGQAAEG